ncbi:helix-turn-helix transcriptional regulator [Spirillospora sp. CA-294931]|uniref:helix-turn-helix transcriptional regulator n=1 Tax=Spirillospora sp. CA-294931 TaxID=3240042 RepID=UPI003D908FC4
MLETSARLLRLLSLLQTHRDWSGRELAERLGVTTRTVRRDVDRLRELGYPVHAAMGALGGYRLGAGASLPPLLLDDDEAVAVTVGLQGAASGGVEGIEEASLRALNKVEQVLPSRLRQRVGALGGAMVTMPARPGGPSVTADLLTTLSAAIRAAETLRFEYVRHDGTPSVREVEPHRLVSWGRRWYLLGWDTGRDDWRTFRADRISPRTPNGPRFTHRDPPDGDVTAFMRRTMGFEMWPHRVRLLLHAPAEEMAARVDGVVTPVDDGTCRVELATESFDLVALVVGLLGVGFEVESPPELADHLRVLAERFSAAARPPAPPDGSRPAG